MKRNENTSPEETEMEERQIISIDSKGRIHLTLTVALVVGFLGLCGINVFTTLSAGSGVESNVINGATKESIDKVEKKVDANTNKISAHTGTLIGIDRDVEHIKETCDRLEEAVNSTRKAQNVQTRLLGELVSELKKWKPGIRGPLNNVE